MTLTDIDRFNVVLPARGRMYFGIVSAALDGYVNGTGFVLTKDSFGIRNLRFVQAQSVDCQGVTFDWDPDTGALKAYTAVSTEAANDALDGMTAILMYWGF